jgi:Na+-transporting NADH:ubiquinone oxidoreductase subunit A
MSRVIKIKKGKNIRLVGESELQILETYESSNYALKPGDYRGIVPKMEVKVGAKVKAGDTIFHSKTNPDVKFTSPVSGEVIEIVRGERRVILEVVVKADESIEYKKFDTNRDVKEVMLESGFWPILKQRPFNVIADQNIRPKAIHISAFDSSPLAPDYNFVLKDEQDFFKRGMAALSTLTDGQVHINVDQKADNLNCFTDSEIANTNHFNGPHPSGLVGVQIHHVDPIMKGDVVWTVNVQHVTILGRFLATGHYDMMQTIALNGSEVKTPAYIKCISGANMEDLFSKYVISNRNPRYISGNVLTGEQIDKLGYIGFYEDQITVIPEGNEYEFLGWLFPSYARPSASKALPYSYSKKAFKVNTNYHGEPRAFVVSGEYEKVLPMDLFPVHLLKACLAQDMENMEKLGIYELVEEDLALCEFVCTSKIKVQQILREGLNLIESEG